MQKRNTENFNLKKIFSDNWVWFSNICEWRNVSIYFSYIIVRKKKTKNWSRIVGDAFWKFPNE